MGLTSVAADEFDRRFLDKLLSALQSDVPYPERVPVKQGIPAAVLMLFGKNSDGEISLLVTKRTETVQTHKGHMAFPGGHSEPYEIEQPESAVLTALRETEEEVGVPRNRIKILGQLPGLWTITGFWITPVIGWLTSPIRDVEIALDSHEIAEVIWVPLSVLRDEQVYRKEFMRVGDINFPIHVFQVGEYRIWGATGVMIKNLLDRFESLS